MMALWFSPQTQMRWAAASSLVMVRQPPPSLTLMGRLACLGRDL